jgi:hypothetical protein
LNKPSPNSTLDKYTIHTIQPPPIDTPSETTNLDIKDTPRTTTSVVKSLSAKEIDYFKAHHGATTLLSADSTSIPRTNSTDKNNISRVLSDINATNPSILGSPYLLPITTSNKNLALTDPLPTSTYNLQPTPRKPEVNLEPLSGIGNEETKSVCVVWEQQDAGVWLDFLQDVSTQHLSTVENMQGKLQVLSGIATTKKKKKKKKKNTNKKK